MQGVVTTLRDMIILSVVGAGLALGVNAVRAKGSVDLTKAYFVQSTPKKTVTQAPAKTPPQAPVEATPQPTPVVATTTPDGSTNNVEEAGEPAMDSDLPLYDRMASVTDRPIEHGYKVVTFDEVVAIMDDSGTEMGANVFVDARNDSSFEEGHIPGSWQVYHYELERYIDIVLPVLQSAEIIVVYCNGGDCEDSGLVCSDLNEAGIDYDRLYLFKEGWEMWTAKGMPVETGRSIAIDGE